MQYIYNSLSQGATQQVVQLIEDIKDKLGAVFKAYSKTTKNKVDKVDKTKLPELLVKEVIKIAAVPKLDLEVINLLDKLIFAAQHISKPIGSINADIKSNNLPN